VSTPCQMCGTDPTQIRAEIDRYRRPLEQLLHAMDLVLGTSWRETTLHPDPSGCEGWDEVNDAWVAVVAALEEM
jgi:hypothetical protein